MNVFDLLDKADAPAQRARMDRRQQGRPESGEMGLRRKDGTEVWVLFESHSIFENGRYQGVLIDDDGHIGAQGHRGAARAQRGAASPGTEVAHIGSW
jgi:PAS domain-containing protein